MHAPALNARPPGVHLCDAAARVSVPAARLAVCGRSPSLPVKRPDARANRSSSAQPLARCRVLPQSTTTTAEADASADVASAPPGKISITLPGVEVLQSIKFDLVPMGKGQAVVAVDVAEGSPAEAAGVTRGARLVAISDPVRYGTMWQLEDRPSLRFVVDTLKMKRSTATDLEFEPLLTPQELSEALGLVAQPPTEGQGAAPAATISYATASDSDSESLSSTLSSIDQTLGGSGAPSTSTQGMTIGERMAQQYEAAQRAKMTANEVTKRIQRRKEYMAMDDQRDDTGLLVGLAAAFVLPAAVILSIAYFSGYLDKMYLTSLIR